MRNISIPNVLSLVRIILVPVTVIFLIDGAFFTALVIFTLAAVTDGLDGLLARLLDQKTILGTYLDPIADKALLTSCFVTLSVEGVIPGWITVIVVSRDFIILFGISILFMISVPFEMRPVFVSKVTTTLQLVTVFIVLIFKSMLVADYHPYLLFMYWLTAGFTTISGFHYILRGVKAINHS